MAKMIDNYMDLTLGLFLRVNAALEDEALDELDKQVRIVALLSGKEVQDVLALPLQEYSALAASTDFLRTKCPPVSAPTRLTENGQVLVPVQDFTTILTTQYVDFQTFSKGGPDMLPDLLSVFLIPEGHQYNDGYDINAVKETARNLPMPVAMSLVGFLFASLLESIRVSLSFLDKTATRLPARRKEQMTKEAERLREMISGLGLDV